MNEHIYKVLFDEFLVGYAHHEMIYDKNNKPIDYKITACNDSYLKFIGKTQDEVNSQTIKELFPDFDNDPFDWVGFYYTISEKGSYEEFIQHSYITKRWHKIIAFSDRKDTFTTVFFDVADVLKTRAQELHTLANTTEVFFNATYETLDPYSLCMDLLDIVKAQAVLYSSTVQLTKSEVSFAYVSQNQTDTKLKALLMNVSKSYNKASINPDSLLKHYTHFYDFCKEQSNVKDCELAKKYGEAIILNVKHKEQYFGHIMLVMSKQQPFTQELLLEIYIRQFGILMAQMIIEYKTKKEKEYYQRILNASRLGTWEWDATTNKIYFNDRFATMLGYTLEEISPMSLKKWLTFSHDEDLEIIQKKLDSLQSSSNDIYSVNCRKKKRDGTYLWVQDEGEVIQRDTSGKIILMSGTYKNIHETKLAQLRLEESERSKDALLSNLPGVSFRCRIDEHWTMIYLSRACEDLTGYKPNELLYNQSVSYQSIIYDADRKNITKVWNDAIQKEKTVTLEYRIITKEGMLKWVWEKGKAIYDAKHQAKYIEGILLDITDRKEVEEKLRIEAERFNTFVNVSHTGAWEYFVDQEFLWCSEPYFSMLGYTLEEFDMSGKPNLVESWIDLIHPRDRDIASNRFKRYLDAGSPGIYENHFRMKHKDGHYVWIWSRGSSVRDNEGNPLPRVMGTHIDISETKALETRLSNEKQRMETTLISVGDGVVSTDVNGKIMLLNRVGEALTGYTQEEVQNNKFNNVFKLFSEHDKRPVFNIVEQVLKTNEKIELEGNPILVSKDGIERPVETSASPIYDVKGRITGVVMVFRDITDKRREQEKILNLSYHDQLTGIYNRRFYEEELKRLDVQRNLPISLIMLDVNGLKMINDSFGHLIGDEWLKATAEILKRSVRADDILARYGGDEFIILLPHTSTENAYKVIDRVKLYSQETAIENITLSLAYGVSTKTDKKENIFDVFKEAEDAMYQHKLYDRENASHETINLIMQSLYAKSPRELAHSKRVGELSRMLAEKLDLSEVLVKEIEAAGLLHDIGKIGISESILNKPDKLDSREWINVKRHPEIGWRILSASKEFKNLAETVLQHHEYFDGTGYPNKLKGDEITIGARIIAIADAYDTMVNNRPYRKKLTLENAIDELIVCSGTQFDPELVNHFITAVLQVESE